MPWNLLAKKCLESERFWYYWKILKKDFLHCSGYFCLNLQANCYQQQKQGRVSKWYQSLVAINVAIKIEKRDSLWNHNDIKNYLSETSNKTETLRNANKEDNYKIINCALIEKCHANLGVFESVFLKNKKNTMKK